MSVKSALLKKALEGKIALINSDKGTFIGTQCDEYSYTDKDGNEKKSNMRMVNLKALNEVAEQLDVETVEAL